MTHEPTPPEAEPAPPDGEPVPPEEAELARLADGSLSADREAALRARVRDSPRLAAALADQERAVELLRALDTPAPESLRARLAGAGVTGTRDAGGAAPGHRTAEGRTAEGRGADRRRRLRRALVLPGATALAVAVAAVVVLVGGGSSPPTVPQTAHLALSSATLPVPRVDPADEYRLALTGAGIPFPNWGTSAGFAPVGARRDRIGGRTVTTVIYRDARGRRVGYAIVSGSALDRSRGRSTTAGGVHFTLARVGAARLITWLRSGHTCVVASRTVGFRRLVKLVVDDAAR